MENVQGLRVALFVAPNEVNPFVEMPADVLAFEGLGQILACQEKPMSDRSRTHLAVQSHKEVGVLFGPWW
jgi:hypothetical protein